MNVAPFANWFEYRSFLFFSVWREKGKGVCKKAARIPPAIRHPQARSVRESLGEDRKPASAVRAPRIALHNHATEPRRSHVLVAVAFSRRSSSLFPLLSFLSPWADWRSAVILFVPHDTFAIAREGRGFILSGTSVWRPTYRRGRWRFFSFFPRTSHLSLASSRPSLHERRPSTPLLLSNCTTKHFALLLLRTQLFPLLPSFRHTPVTDRHQPRHAIPHNLSTSPVIISPVLPLSPSSTSPYSPIRLTRDSFLFLRYPHRHPRPPPCDLSFLRCITYPRDCLLRVVHWWTFSTGSAPSLPSPLLGCEIPIHSTRVTIIRDVVTSYPTTTADRHRKGLTSSPTYRSSSNAPARDDSPPVTTRRATQPRWLAPPPSLFLVNYLSKVFLDLFPPPSNELR